MSSNASNTSTAPMLSSSTSTSNSSTGDSVGGCCGGGCGDTMPLLEDRGQQSRDRGQQSADSRQQTADSRQQAADSRQEGTEDNAGCYDLGSLDEPMSPLLDFAPSHHHPPSMPLPKSATSTKSAKSALPLPEIALSPPRSLSTSGSEMARLHLPCPSTPLPRNIDSTTAPVLSSYFEVVPSFTEAPAVCSSYPQPPSTPLPPHNTTDSSTAPIFPPLSGEHTPAHNLNCRKCAALLLSLTAPNPPTESTSKLAFFAAFAPNDTSPGGVFVLLWDSRVTFEKLESRSTDGSEVPFATCLMRCDV
jgi:hypothetical protein